MSNEKTCFKHPGSKASSFCHSCGKYYCEECLTEGPEYWYCKDIECQKQYKLDIKDYADKVVHKIVPRDIFCPKCVSETTDETTGNLETFNLTGTTIHGIRDNCPVCGSYIANKYFVFCGIPLYKLGSYRVITLKDGAHKTEFVSRKLKLIQNEIYIYL